jgi:hypothetical protein
MCLLHGRAIRTRTLSYTGPTGIHHSVEVQAETPFEAAGMGLALLRKADWIDPIAPGTRIEVRVKSPETPTA